ncbi:MAG TPA: Smr/MutS family protein [Longimicrobiales bacterium]|nr:Smr/MutS family protein [Longimicrobiales bacterium]
MAKRAARAGAERDPFEPLAGPVGDTLDLHGFGAAAARDATIAFVGRARRRAPGSLVHVITGRGRGSERGPVLKGVVRTLLRSGQLPAADWGEDLDGGGFLIRLR